MKGLMLGGLSALALASGVWAYRENYATQGALGDVRALKGQIATAEAALDRLGAEWAYLNRPDRLRDLAELNFGRLELLPLEPEAFGQVERVPMPLGRVDPLSTAVAGAELRPGEEPL